MKNVLEYKGYCGTVEFSADDEVFFGKLAGIKDVVTFEADSVSKLKKVFREAVDDYLKHLVTNSRFPVKNTGSFSK